ncbi:MAG: hypothetical protein CMI85_06065 [Candidatus Pelagibacter sp.]|nr:hypothetical protein [Candidatus Pelagibacter sp.]
MTITRRNLLLGAASAIAYTQLSALQTKADIKIASKAGDQQMVASMCRALYPHKRFAENIYMDVAAGAIKKGNADTGSKIMFRVGLDGLQAKKFDKLSFKKQTKYLKSIEGSPFFNLVRGHTTVALYDHKQVWKILGYEGDSFSKGGYKKGQYDDLDWLPNPRIEEHPDLAAFLNDSSPTKYASSKIIKTN